MFIFCACFYHHLLIFIVGCQTATSQDKDVQNKSRLIHVTYVHISIHRDGKWVQLYGLSKSRLHDRTVWTTAQPDCMHRVGWFLYNYDRTADDVRFSLVVYASPVL